MGLTQTEAGQTSLGAKHDDHRYRPNVGLAVFNDLGQVFLGRRLKTPPPYQWQMPQGGIDRGETPIQAALRELEEEAGIKPHLVEVLEETAEWLHYEFPPEIQARLGKRDRYCGQKQKWFSFKYLGGESDIRLDTAHPEFAAWRWAPLEDTPALVIPFKRPIYEDVVRRFMKYTRPATSA